MSSQSTLCNLISRIIHSRDTNNENQNSGVSYISWNDKSIYEISLKEYRTNYVNVFPQDAYIFTGTIRQAIDPLSAYSDNVLLHQLQKFSKGMYSLENTVISNRILNLSLEITKGGSNLSAGEKQILVLVRASLSLASVIILDEITSHMDIDTAAIAISILK